MNTCSCGKEETHIVARRNTIDGVSVQLRSTGEVTGSFGYPLKGMPVARPRTSAGRVRALTAGWLLLGLADSYSYDELGGLYSACRWAADRDGLPGTVRARYVREVTPKLVPVWSVSSTDRDGKVVERYWRLPNGTVVWDTGGAHRYEIMRTVQGSNETCVPTGIKFAGLDALFSFLREERASNRSAS